MYTDTHLDTCIHRYSSSKPWCTCEKLIKLIGQVVLQKPGLVGVAVAVGQADQHSRGAHTEAELFWWEQTPLFGPLKAAMTVCWDIVDRLGIWGHRGQDSASP